MLRFILTLAATLILGSSALSSDTLPQVYDVVILAGEDYHRIFRLTQDTTGTPVNLTGNSYQAQCRPTFSAAAFATYSTIVEVPASGEIHVKLSNRQTGALSGKSGVWDLRQTTAAGVSTYLLTGRCTVRPTVTR